MYAIHQFKVRPSIETLVVLLEAEETTRLKVSISADMAASELRCYKRLTVLLALLMVLLSLLMVVGSVGQLLFKLPIL